MIKINLIAEAEAKPRRAARAPSQYSPLTILIAIAVAAALFGYYYLGIKRPLNARRQQASALKSEVDRLTKSIEEKQQKVAGLKELQDISESMLEIVNALDPEDRILWSEKLNQISDLVPDNVYITRIQLTEKVTKRETAASKRARAEWEAQQKGKRKGRRRGTVPGAPKPVYYPEIVHTLVITAIADSESENERLRLMNQFHDNLASGTNPKTKVQCDFLKGFQKVINYGRYQQRLIGDREVAEFSFTLKTKPTSPKKSTKKTGGG